MILCFWCYTCINYCNSKISVLFCITNAYRRNKWETVSSFCLQLVLVKRLAKALIRDHQTARKHKLIWIFVNVNSIVKTAFVLKKNCFRKHKLQENYNKYVHCLNQIAFLCFFFRGCSLYNFAKIRKETLLGVKSSQNMLHGSNQFHSKD